MVALAPTFVGAVNMLRIVCFVALFAFATPTIVHDHCTKSCKEMFEDVSEPDGPFIYEEWQTSIKLYDSMVTSEEALEAATATLDRIDKELEKADATKTDTRNTARENVAMSVGAMLNSQRSQSRYWGFFKGSEENKKLRDRAANHKRGMNLAMKDNDKAKDAIIKKKQNQAEAKKIKGRARDASEKAKRAFEAALKTCIESCEFMHTLYVRAQKQHTLHFMLLGADLADDDLPTLAPDKTSD